MTMLTQKVGISQWCCASLVNLNRVAGQYVKFLGEEFN
jgi:hypothetical protein